MITCGLKLTHDGAIALVEDNQLMFSIEVEKLNNNKRYSTVEDLKLINDVLDGQGYKAPSIHKWVLDGWDGHQHGSASSQFDGRPETLRTAAYRENDSVPDLLVPGYQAKLGFLQFNPGYVSYAHLAGHLASAYCTSPFAGNGEPSIGLVWDGGTFPRIYYIDELGRVENGGHLFPMTGHSYATSAHHFGPYKREDASQSVDDLGVAGKLMAYIALGKEDPKVIETLERCFEDSFDGLDKRARDYRLEIGGWGSHAEPSVRYLNEFYNDLQTSLRPLGVPEVDVLASVHAFIESTLLTRLEERVNKWKGPGPWNLSFAGGCALNIKWNSAIRQSSLFKTVWIPPFPNDSGSAIGAACLDHSVSQTGGLSKITWNVRSGPSLPQSEAVPAGWQAQPCDITQLARTLHETKFPVIVLNGAAELGPRALGGRSIFASAEDGFMKSHLNEIKNREQYRPVAPICLEEFAPQVFDPGTPDPYMLFEHNVRPDWADRVPAICHLDGTARLQTVGPHDDATTRRLLQAYHELSGVPLLCNTSANYNGSGFFPDVASAAKWGRVSKIWSNGTLFARADG